MNFINRRSESTSFLNASLSSSLSFKLNSGCDIFFDNKGISFVVNFEYNKTGLIRLFRKKNARERIEYLMPRTKQALLNWQKHLDYKRRRIKIDKVKSDHVFCRIDGTPIKNFNKSWWAARRAAGLNDFHFHDLRHTFCSNLIISGSDLKDAKEMIGHADISMTDRYSHLTGLHKRIRQERLAQHYANNK